LADLTLGSRLYKWLPIIPVTGGPDPRAQARGSSSSQQHRNRSFPSGIARTIISAT